MLFVWGSPTEAEKQLGPHELAFPDEDTVLAIAQQWSLNPSTFDSKLPAGIGWVGRLSSAEKGGH